MSEPIPGSAAAAERSALLTDLERARGIAVALEQENADLHRRVAELETTVRGLSGMVLDQGDVVGQEGLPLGDPWAESPIPEDWREEE